MVTKNSISYEQAYNVGDALGINWNVIDINQFRRGLEVELEHGLVANSTDVTHNDILLTGKIALAHLNELSDYYTRLEVIENVKFNVSSTNQLINKKSNNSLFAGLALGVGLVMLGKYITKNKA